MAAPPRAFTLKSAGNRPARRPRLSLAPPKRMANYEAFSDADRRYYRAKTGKRRLRPLLAALLSWISGIALLVGLLVYRHGLRPPTSPHIEEDEGSISSNSGSMKVYEVSSSHHSGPLPFFEQYIQRLAEAKASAQAKEHERDPTSTPATTQDPHNTKELPLDSVTSSEDWNLPRVSDREESLSHAEQLGKQFIAKVVKQHEATDPVPSPEAQSIFKTVALRVTHGLKDKLTGLTISLSEISPLGGTSKGNDNETPRAFKVVKFLGEGTFKVVLEVIDEESNESFALSIMFMPKGKEDGGILTASQQFANAMEQEEKNIKAACKGNSPVVAADQQGISAPLFLARLVGVPSVFAADHAYVWGRVQVLERLHGNMHELTKDLQTMPLEAKTYIARRLLLQVLHLQEARVSHNDIKWANLFARSDGSFLLGDFGSSSIIGERMNQIGGISLCYAEPNLVLDFYHAMFEGRPALPDHRSDMWSLGVLLFELFTDGGLPYGIRNYTAYLESLKARMTALLRRNVTPTVLLQDLQEGDVPERWKELILRLLEPKREKRITAATVATEFRDLFWDSGLPES